MLFQHLLALGVTLPGAFAHVKAHRVVNDNVPSSAAQDSGANGDEDYNNINDTLVYVS